MRRWGTAVAWAALITTAVTVVVFLSVPRGDASGEAVAPPGSTAPTGPLPDPGTSPTAGPQPQGEPSSSALWDPLVQIPGDLDPADLPLRRVEQAAFLATVYGDAEQRSVIALDATTGDWVRADVPWLETWGLLLSPDGREVARTVFTAPFSITIVVTQLASGQSRTVPFQLHGDDDACVIDAITWAPDGTHLGVVSGCVTYIPGPSPDDPWFAGGAETWVDEIDLATGTSRMIEHRPDTYPLENSPSYSPDGRFFAYGLDTGAQPDGVVDHEEEWESLRVVQLDGTAAYEWDLLHVVNGDPWADSRTILAWDDELDPGSADAFRLVDATTGGSTSLGLAHLTNTNGFVAGRLLIQPTMLRGEPSSCEVALCLADVATGRTAPWLVLPEGYDVRFVSPARGLTAQASS